MFLLVVQDTYTEKGLLIRKEEIKQPLFSDDMVIYKENSKESTKEPRSNM